jgi:hypothetical protein
MTKETFAKLIEDHARFPAAVQALVEGATVETLRAREAENRWSPLEILAHLRDEETEDFGARARVAVEGRELVLDVDPERWVVERRYNEMDPEEVRSVWARERAASCVWLASLSLADLERSVDHPRFGSFRAGDFIAAWRVHDLLHLRQLAHAMAVNAARTLDGWRVEYAGSVPGSG